MADSKARRYNIQGAAWMIAAMLFFALEDMLIKRSAQSLLIGQVLTIFGAGGLLCFHLIARAKEINLWSWDSFSPTMCLRFGFELSGRLFYFLALSLVPPSTATVILQATPLVVVAAAAVVLKERVGRIRWSSIAIGLLGVIIIIDPRGDSFTPAALLAVLGMLGFAGRDFTSRMAPVTVGTVTLGFYGFLAVLVAGIGYSLWDGSNYVQPDPATMLYLLGSIFTGLCAYSSLMKAMRTGEVSFVTPFRYTRLLFGVGLGLMFFGESLTGNTVVESVLILAAGLVLVWRGRR